jgi:cell division inhibitor SepF
MNIFDKVCGKMGLMDPEDEKEELEEYFEEEEKKPSFMKQDEENRMNHYSESSNNVVDFHSAASARESAAAATKVKVVVIEPKSFDDAQQVANNLRERKPVVINFEHTEGEAAKRIIDFISGTTYALNGEIKKVGHNVFLCAPSNVNVSYTEEEKKVSAEMPWLKK